MPSQQLTFQENEPMRHDPPDTVYKLAVFLANGGHLISFTLVPAKYPNTTVPRPFAGSLTEQPMGYCEIITQDFTMQGTIGIK